MPHILLVDDEPAQRQSLRKALETRDYKVAEADSVDEVDRNYRLQDFDLVITELKLPGEAGSELIRRAQPVPVIVMTNYASLRSAIDSMKLGAVDYLTKPCGSEEFIAVVEQALAENSSRPSQPATAPCHDSRQFFEGRCEELRQLDRNIEKVAKTESNVLILGETGTGKELTACRVHAQSKRSHRRMIAVNCAAIPDTLIESELFGYEKGAFTGANTNRIGLIEAADGGTLFLDEIGELPLAAQARLLRFIQEGEIRRIGAVSSRRVDVRLICATHRELADLAAKDEFRQDLFYRINVLRLEIPPLRDRSDDLPAMAKWFAHHIPQRLGLPARPLHDDALALIEQYDWPGNVRELEHAIERAIVMADSDTLQPEDMGLTISRAKPRVRLAPATTERYDTASTDDEAASEISGELSLEDYFQRFVLEHQDSMSETELAQKLGISRKCLWERRQRFDIPRTRRKKRA
jgi:two-component system response regulator HydG